MKTYAIYSPNGNEYNFTTDSVYAAISMAAYKDGFKYSTTDYINLNNKYFSHASKNNRKKENQARLQR